MAGFVIVMTEEDLLWHNEGCRRGWQLPEAAGAFWRCWGIRHARAFLRLWCVYYPGIDLRDVEALRAAWLEEWTCYAIQRGWC